MSIVNRHRRRITGICREQGITRKRYKKNVRAARIGAARRRKFGPLVEPRAIEDDPTSTTLKMDRLTMTPMPATPNAIPRPREPDVITKEKFRRGVEKLTGRPFPGVTRGPTHMVFTVIGAVVVLAIAAAVYIW